MSAAERTRNTRRKRLGSGFDEIVPAPIRCRPTTPVRDVTVKVSVLPLARLAVFHTSRLRNVEVGAVVRRNEMFFRLGGDEIEDTFERLSGQFVPAEPPA